MLPGNSVSQALYGIALGTQTAQKMLKGDPSRAGEPFGYVLSLAEAGMAEMRALIFELRPESLEQEGLVAALGKQVAAMEARHGVEIEDDGLGFDAGADFPGHLGLRSMREWAARLGGTLEVQSAPGSGTMVSARVRTRPHDALLPGTAEREPLEER